MVVTIGCLFVAKLGGRFHLAPHLVIAISPFAYEQKCQLSSAGVGLLRPWAFVALIVFVAYPETLCSWRPFVD